ncbi:MAG TPA: hypothetical protein VL443_23780 [Cyclobacteriaceae bacterium]|jgi:hypothetical protein|nr:hypothetical protein [Cyclobacteriaceae bacterium]
MKTQANINSENMTHVSTQMRFVLTLVGIVVAVAGSLTLLYENHSVAGMDFKPKVKEASMLSITILPKIETMNVVAAIWPF